MRRKTKIIIALGVICASTLTFAACADSSPHKDLAEQGYEVSVCFDSNGGDFSNTPDVNIVDDFRLEDVQKGIKLLEPGSPKRGPGESISRISRTNYSLVGWYRTRELRTNADGDPLDEDGNVCNVRVFNEDGTLKGYVSETGKEQGYIYSDRWNFDTDIFQVDDYNYRPGEYTMTLYAAWANYSYAVYGQETDRNGNVHWAYQNAYTVAPEFSTGEVALPAWDSSGALDYGSFPSVDNKTIVDVYADEAMTQKITDKLVHRGSLDLEHGVSVNGMLKCYATFRDGIWYRIERAEQLIENSVANGCYELFADLDFEGLTWNYNLTVADFTGKLVSHGTAKYKLSNITVTQSNISDIYGGLFGRITASAEIRDVEFVNLVYNLNMGSRMQGASFGTFAGTISQEATIENVTLTGELVVGNEVFVNGLYAGYAVGIVSGNNQTSNITAQVTARSAGDKREVEVSGDGTVTIKAVVQ